MPVASKSPPASASALAFRKPAMIFERTIADGSERDQLVYDEFLDMLCHARPSPF